MAGKRAVVFSGGGAKGGYQIGAWQALRELNFSPDIVTGTSVGAFNGALMVSDKYAEALEIWENMSMDRIFSQFAEAVNNEESKQDDFIKRLAKEAIFKGGADYSPLHSLIMSHLDEEIIRNSKIDFGLVTTTFPYRKRVQLFIEDIPQGEAIDYVIASASAFPLVKSYKIGQSKYIDGGYSDNMPIQMALDRGAEEIVAVNIGKMAVHKLKENNAVIHYVHNKRPFNDGQFGSVAIFEKELSLNNIRQGYLDTCKTFNLFDGYYYTFEKYECYKISAFEGVCTLKFNNIFSVLPSENHIERIGKQNVIELLQKYEQRPFEINNNVLYCAEIAAEIFDLNPREIYTLQGIAELLIVEAAKLIADESTNMIAALARQLDKGLSFDLLKTILKNWDKKLILGFSLQLMLEDKLEQAQKRRLWLVAALMPDVFCSALFCCSAILNSKH
ncbi:MAG: patatin-like phospholipase family protein [Eubacteriales bacterium]